MPGRIRLDLCKFSEPFSSDYLEAILERIEGWFIDWSTFPGHETDGEIIRPQLLLIDSSTNLLGFDGLNVKTGYSNPVVTDPYLIGVVCPTQIYDEIRLGLREKFKPDFDAEESTLLKIQMIMPNHYLHQSGESETSYLLSEGTIPFEGRFLS